MGVVDVVDGAVRWYARAALGVEHGDGVAVLVKSYTYLLGVWSCFAITDDPADDRLYEVTRDASGGVHVRHYDAAPDRVYEQEEEKTMDGEDGDGKPIEAATAYVRIKPDLSEARAMLLRVLDAIDDPGEHDVEEG